MAIPKPATDFIAYDVYRANCTRWGWTDPNAPYVSDSSTSKAMNVDQNELYMEFGAPTLVEQHLPPELGEWAKTKGLCAEVRLYIYGTEPKGNNTTYWYTPYDHFALGWCERIEKDEPIIYNNIKNRNYTSNPKVDLYQATNSMDMLVKALKYTSNTNLSQWKDLSYIVKANYLSIASTSPSSTVDLVDAMEKKAIILKRYLASYDEYARYSPPTLHTSRDVYLQIIVGTIEPKIRMHDPYNYVNPRVSQITKWEFNYTGKIWNIPPGNRVFVGGIAPSQNYAEVQFRKQSGEIAIVEVNGDSKQANIPTEVMTSGDFFEWKVSVTNEVGARGESDWYKISTVDAIPSVKPIRPVNVLVDASESVTFEWNYSVSTQMPPTGFELQLKKGNVWKTIAANSQTDQTNAIVPATDLSTQGTAWRVRASNTDGVFSEWSAAANVVLRLAPTVERVETTGNTMPTISWVCNDQQGYEVRVDGVSSGILYGETVSYKWPDILMDGIHEVSVRAVNRFGLFSQWVAAIHTVANVPFYPIVNIHAIEKKHGDVWVSWPQPGAANALIYRDGELVGKVSDGVSNWVDRTATGRHVYMVRLVDATGAYTDTHPSIVKVRLRKAYIAKEGAWEWEELLWLQGDELPGRSTSYQPAYALNYYSGRILPAAELSAHRSIKHTITYSVDKEVAERIIEWVGRIVVYKRAGECIRGLLTSIGEVREWSGHTLTMQIEEVS